MRMVLYYFAVISAVSIVVTALDKSRAKTHRFRVPERTLLILAVLGGGAAMYVTMRLIRHKTRHKKFMIGIPAIVIAELLVGCAVYILR